MTKLTKNVVVTQIQKRRSFSALLKACQYYSYLLFSNAKIQSQKSVFMEIYRAFLEFKEQLAQKILKLILFICSAMDYFGHNQYFAQLYDNSEDESVQICPLVNFCEGYPRVEDLLHHQKMPDLDDSPFGEDKKLQSTLEVTEEIETEEKVQIQEKSEAKTNIFFQQKIIEKYKEVYRGTKDDTVQLNINFKTLLVHYFKELRMLNELNDYQIKHVNEFNDRVPSFHSVMIFFQNTQDNKQIRQRSLEFFSSPECIKRIFTGRSKMKTKLQMVKFIEKMRFNILTQGKGYKWKDNIKKRN